ncbi:MAG: IclR family transcriptional regulator [Steroidobacteraceae bacterium]
MTTSDRMLSVLDLFDQSTPQWSVEAAAAELGLATSTAYRYFASLTAAGLLAPFVSGRYILGPTILRYDRQLRLTDPLISASSGQMRKLARLEPNRSVVFLCRLLGGQVMCVHQVAEGEPTFAVGYERGRLMPLFAGSASKIILAHLPLRQLRSLFARESESFANAGLGKDWDTVRRTLRSIRSDGYAVTHGEVDRGMKGFSVPLPVENSAMLASLTIAGPANRLPDDASDIFIPALHAAAARIGKVLQKTIEAQASDEGTPPGP